MKVNDIVSVEDISFEYVTEEDKFKAIDNLSLNVKQGEFVVVIGHNGSGKSTLSKNLNAILMPTTGNIYINGLNTKEENMSPEKLKSNMRDIQRKFQSQREA